MFYLMQKFSELQEGQWDLKAVSRSAQGHLLGFDPATLGQLNLLPRPTAFEKPRSQSISGSRIHDKNITNIAIDISDYSPECLTNELSTLLQTVSEPAFLDTTNTDDTWELQFRKRMARGLSEFEDSIDVHIACIKVIQTLIQKCITLNPKLPKMSSCSLLKLVGEAYNLLSERLHISAARKLLFPVTRSFSLSLIPNTRLLRSLDNNGDCRSFSFVGAFPDLINSETDVNEVAFPDYDMLPNMKQDYRDLNRDLVLFCDEIIKGSYYSTYELLLADMLERLVGEQKYHCKLDGEQSWIDLRLTLCRMLCILRFLNRTFSGSVIYQAIGELAASTLTNPEESQYHIIPRSTQAQPICLQATGDYPQKIITCETRLDFDLIGTTDSFSETMRIEGILYLNIPDLAQFGINMATLATIISMREVESISSSDKMALISCAQNEDLSPFFQLFCRLFCPSSRTNINADCKGIVPPLLRNMWISIKFRPAET